MFKKFMGFLTLFFVVSHTVFADATDPLIERQHQNQLAKTTPNIYKLTTKTEVAYKLQTAVGYTTTVDLPEEALKVFVGDSDLFKVEVYEKQVIIKPATDYRDARTNLTVYMQSSRVTFDVSVGSPETADFILDFRLPRDEALVDNEFKNKLNEKKGELESAYQQKIKKEDEVVKQKTHKKFEEEIKKGAGIKKLNASSKQDGIEIKLISLTEVGGKSYLRFSLHNHTDRDYELEMMVMVKETVKRRFLFFKRREGFVPVPISFNGGKIIPKQKYQYGLVSFEKLALRKNEHLILKVYEKGNVQCLEIRNIPWEVR